jgi:hypothetical protein
LGGGRVGRGVIVGSAVQAGDLRSSSCASSSRYLRKYSKGDFQGSMGVGATPEPSSMNHK